MSSTISLCNFPFRLIFDIHITFSHKCSSFLFRCFWWFSLTWWFDLNKYFITLNCSYYEVRIVWMIPFCQVDYNILSYLILHLTQYVMSGLRSQYNINLRSNSERYTILVTSPTYFLGCVGRYKPLYDFFISL